MNQKRLAFAAGPPRKLGLPAELGSAVKSSSMVDDAGALDAEETWDAPVFGLSSSSTAASLSKSNRLSIPASNIGGLRSLISRSKSPLPSSGSGKSGGLLTTPRQTADDSSFGSSTDCGDLTDDAESIQKNIDWRDIFASFGFESIKSCRRTRRNSEVITVMMDALIESAKNVRGDDGCRSNQLQHDQKDEQEQEGPRGSEVVAEVQLAMEFERRRTAEAERRRVSAETAASRLEEEMVELRNTVHKLTRENEMLQTECREIKEHVKEVVGLGHAAAVRAAQAERHAFALQKALENDVRTGVQVQSSPNFADLKAHVESSDHDLMAEFATKAKLHHEAFNNAEMHRLKGRGRHFS